MVKGSSLNREEMIAKEENLEIKPRKYISSSALKCKNGFTTLPLSCRFIYESFLNHFLNLPIFLFPGSWPTHQPILYFINYPQGFWVSQLVFNWKLITTSFPLMHQFPPKTIKFYCPYIYHFTFISQKLGRLPLPLHSPPPLFHCCSQY